MLRILIKEYVNIAQQPGRFCGAFSARIGV
jgi:hypothetical protein